MNKKYIIDNIKGKMGFEELNPMQLSVLSSDASRILLLAPTGSGKTVAFTAALLRVLENPAGKLQGVILAPSRELAVQTGEVIRKIAAGFKVCVFYGGHPMSAEISSVEGGMPDIVVATPGRLLDHLDRGTITLRDMRGYVADEYDKLLDLGFEDEMKKISRRFPRRISLLMLTSATEVEPLPAYLDLKDLTTIDFRERTADPRSRMQVVEIESPVRDKLDTLRDLLLTLPPDSRSIVFVNHRESAERVFGMLRKAGFAAGMYHGGQEQREREQAVELFNNGTTPVLVATDLAARGLDIADVGSIIHYHLPQTQEIYTHRNGRTARVNAGGSVYVITAEGENIPEFIVADRRFAPRPQSERPVPATMASLYINAGKKQKISRGDIAGFLIANAGLEAGEVGRINVRDTNAIVAVPREKAGNILKDIAGKKLKNKSVRITLIQA